MGRTKGSKNKSLKNKYLHEGTYWTIKNMASAYNLDWQLLHKFLVIVGDSPRIAIKKAQSIKDETYNHKLLIGVTYSYLGDDLTLRQWSTATGIKLGTLRSRVLKKKWSIKKAIKTKVRNNNE